MQQDGVAGEKEGGTEGGIGDVKNHRMTRVMPLVPIFGHHLFSRGTNGFLFLISKFCSKQQLLLVLGQPQHFFSRATIGVFLTPTLSDCMFVSKLMHIAQWHVAFRPVAIKTVCTVVFDISC